MSIVPQTAQWYEDDASGAEVALARITLRGDGRYLFTTIGVAAAALTQRGDGRYIVNSGTTTGLPIYAYGTMIEVRT